MVNKPMEFPVKTYFEEHIKTGENARFQNIFPLWLTQFTGKVDSRRERTFVDDHDRKLTALFVITLVPEFPFVTLFIVSLSGVILHDDIKASITISFCFRFVPLKPLQTGGKMCQFTAKWCCCHSDKCKYSVNVSQEPSLSQNNLPSEIIETHSTDCFSWQ